MPHAGSDSFTRFFYNCCFVLNAVAEGKQRITLFSNHSGSPRPQPGANAVAVAHLATPRFSSFCTVYILAGGVLSLTYNYSRGVH